MSTSEANPAPAGDLSSPPDRYASSSEGLAAAASNGDLNEDQALALLQRSDLPPAVIEQLSKNGTAMKSRKLKLAVAEHPKTPRHVSLPLLRNLFIFELMQVALAPAAPADLKKSAEEALLNRLEGTSLGEKISLARRASARVAGALLLDADPRVIQAALENPYLTEASVIKALTHRNASASFVQTICRHAKWSLRREIRIALLRNEFTPLAQALRFARGLPPALVREVLEVSALPENIKTAIVAS